MQNRNINTTREEALFGSGKTRVTRESSTTNVEQHGCGSACVQSRHEQCTGNVERMFSCTQSPNVDDVFCTDDTRGENVQHTHTTSVTTGATQNSSRLEFEHGNGKRTSRKSSMNAEKSSRCQQTPNVGDVFCRRDMEGLGTTGSENSQSSLRVAENSQTSFRGDNSFVQKNVSCIKTEGKTASELTKSSLRHVFPNESQSKDRQGSIATQGTVTTTKSSSVHSDDESYEHETHRERFQRALSRFETGGLQKNEELESSQTSFRTKSISSKRCSFADDQKQQHQSKIEENKLLRKSVDFGEVFDSSRGSSKSDEFKRTGGGASSLRVRERNDTGYGSCSSVFSNNCGSTSEQQENYETKEMRVSLQSDITVSNNVGSVSERDDNETKGIRVYQPEITVQKVVTSSRDGSQGTTKSGSILEQNTDEMIVESTNVLHSKNELHDFQSTQSTFDLNVSKGFSQEQKMESSCILTNQRQSSDQSRLESSTIITSKDDLQELQRTQLSSNTSSHEQKKAENRLDLTAEITDATKMKVIQSAVKPAKRTTSGDTSSNEQKKKKKIKVKVKQVDHIATNVTHDGVASTVKDQFVDTKTSKRTGAISSLPTNHVKVPKSNISFAFVSRDTLDRVTSQAKKFPPIKYSNCATMTDLEKADARIGRIVSRLKEQHTDISNEVLDRKLSKNHENKKVITNQIDTPPKPIKTSFQIKLKNPEACQSIKYVGDNTSSVKYVGDNTSSVKVSKTSNTEAHKDVLMKQQNEVQNTNLNTPLTDCKPSSHVQTSRTIEKNKPESKNKSENFSSSNSSTKRSSHITIRDKTDLTFDLIATERATHETIQSHHQEKDKSVITIGSTTEKSIQGHKKITEQEKSYNSKTNKEEAEKIDKKSMKEANDELSTKANLTQTALNSNSRTIQTNSEKSSNYVPADIMISGNIKVQFEADDVASANNIKNSSFRTERSGDTRKLRCRTESYERILSETTPRRKYSEGTAPKSEKGILGEYLDKIVTEGGIKRSSSEDQANDRARTKSSERVRLPGHYRREIEIENRRYVDDADGSGNEMNRVKSTTMDSKQGTTTRDARCGYSSDSSETSIKRARTVSYERILPTHCQQNRRKHSEQNEKRLIRREVQIFQLLDRKQENTAINEKQKKMARQLIFDRLKEGDGEHSQGSPFMGALHRRDSRVSNSCEAEEEAEENDCKCSSERNSLRFEKLSPCKYHVKASGHDKEMIRHVKPDLNKKSSNDTQITETDSDRNISSPYDTRGQELSTRSLQTQMNSKTQLIRRSLEKNIDNRHLSVTNSDTKTNKRTSNESIRVEPTRKMNTNQTETIQHQSRHANTIQQTISHQNGANSQNGNQVTSIQKQHREACYNNNGHHDYVYKTKTKTNNVMNSSNLSNNSSEGKFNREKKGCHGGVDSINQDMNTHNNTDQIVNIETVGKRLNQCLLNRGGDSNDKINEHYNENAVVNDEKRCKRTLYKCNIVEVPLTHKNEGNISNYQNVNKEIPEKVNYEGTLENVTKKQIIGTETHRELCSSASGRLNEKNVHGSSSFKQKREETTLHSMEGSRRNCNESNPLVVHMNKTVQHSVDYENILPNSNSCEKMDVIFREYVDLDSNSKETMTNCKQTYVSESVDGGRNVSEAKARPVSAGHEKTKKVMRRRSVKIYSAEKDGKRNKTTPSKSESDKTSHQNNDTNPESPFINLLDCHDPFETVCSLEKCTLCHHHGNTNENNDKDLGGEIKNHDVTISYKYKLDRKNPVETDDNIWCRDGKDGDKKVRGCMFESSRQKKSEQIKSEQPLTVVIRRNVNHEITKTELLVEMNK